MMPSKDFEQIFKLWHAHASEAKRQKLDREKHPSSEEIYRLALPGGASQSPPENLQHLSLCPLCLRTWAAWRQALSDVDESDEDTSVCMTYGFLKAAASRQQPEPIRMVSACSRFCLSILPQLESTDEGLVTLEAVAEEGQRWNNRRAVVKDRHGRILLEGHLKQGHLARYHPHLSVMDLSKWTVVIE
jgi:hypothetical protein